MHAERPSYTSSFVAMARAVFDAAPRSVSATQDPLAQALIPKAMRTWSRALSAAWIAPRLGHATLRALTLGLFEQVALRTVAIDAVIADAMRGGVSQLVVLGAGLDARAFRLPALGGARVFEVDHPATQAYKRRKTARHTPLARHHALVPVDFSKDALIPALRAAGFDPSVATVWLMEGVTMYLPGAAVEATCRDVRAASAPGSLFALTYMPPLPKVLRPFIDVGFGALGEPLVGTIETAALHGVLRSHGFAVSSDEGPRDWARRYTPAVSRVGMTEFERLLVAQIDGRERPAFNDERAVSR